MTPFLGSKKELLGQSGCVRHPRLFIMVGVYSPTLYNNWGVEWESLFSQPLFHGMPEGFEHCSSGYIGKICSGALRWFTGLHMPCFMQPEDVRKIVDGLLKTYWECHPKSQLTHIFPRGRLKPPTNDESLLYQGVDLGNWSDHQQWGETLKNNGIAVQQCMFLPCPNYKP